MKYRYNHLKKLDNPLILLKEELWLTGLDSNEINDILERYKSTYDYTFYELRIASYNFVRTMKKLLKKYQKYFKEKILI